METRTHGLPRARALPLRSYSKWLTAGDPGITHQGLFRMSISAGFNRGVCNLLVFLVRPQSTWTFWATSLHTALPPLSWETVGSLWYYCPLNFFFKCPSLFLPARTWNLICFKKVKNPPKLVRGISRFFFSPYLWFWWADYRLKREFLSSCEWSQKIKL